MKGKDTMNSKYSLNFKLVLLILSLTLMSGLSTAETLQEIYELALRNDSQLKADIAAYEAGKEGKKIGLSNLLPNINGGVSYSDSSRDSEGQQVFNGIPVGPASTSTTDSTSTGYSASLSQPLFDLPAWYSYKQGNLNTEQAEIQFKADQQAFIIRVAQAYFNVLRAIDGLETSIAEQTALESQLEQTRQRFEVGLTAITDVYEAQASYDSAVANTLSSRGNLGIAYEALAVLTGQAHDSVAPVVENFQAVNPVPENRADWVDFAMQNNYNLESARLNAEASRLTSKIRTSAHLPTLSADIRYSHNDGDTESSLNPGSISNSISDTTSYSINLNVPIYSGGRTSAQRRQAYQNYMRAQELYNSTQRQTIQSARSLHLAVETSVAQVAARQQAIVSNQSALEATQAGYEVGTRNLVDVLQAQRSLFLAQRAYYTALYDYILNTLSLKQAAGLLNPKDIEELNQFLDSANQVNRSDFEQ